MWGGFIMGKLKKDYSIDFSIYNDFDRTERICRNK